jgi:hypothetical protein
MEFGRQIPTFQVNLLLQPSVEMKENIEVVATLLTTYQTTG